MSRGTCVAANLVAVHTERARSYLHNAAEFHGGGGVPARRLRSAVEQFAAESLEQATANSVVIGGQIRLCDVACEEDRAEFVAVFSSTNSARVRHTGWCGWDVDGRPDLVVVFVSCLRTPHNSPWPALRAAGVPEVWEVASDYPETRVRSWTGTTYRIARIHHERSPVQSALLPNYWFTLSRFRPRTYTEAVDATEGAP